MLQQIRDKSRDYLHGQLVEPVQVKRQQRNWLIWLLFTIFMVASLAIVLVYYFVYIDGQLVRIDLDYGDRESYLEDGKKINCDCALPIAINPSKITNDPDFLQPDFRICLKRNLFNYFPSQLLNNTVTILSFNILAMPLNTNLKDTKQYFKNLIVSNEPGGDIMTKIGNITLLRYLNEVQNSFLNYFSIYTVDLIESTSWLKHEVDTDVHDDAIDDLLMHYNLADRRYQIMTEIIGCYDRIDFDKIHPEHFLDGLTAEQDCVPVNCHLFDKYSRFQGLLLIVTFYLAVIGYVLFILQCFYQKMTKIETENDVNDDQNSTNNVSNTNDSNTINGDANNNDVEMGVITETKA